MLHFFSVYKGTHPEFSWNTECADDFFLNVLPKLKLELDSESLSLISETIDEKFRIIQGTRFPENSTNDTCYISMSEAVISPTGEETNCSHLYRDNVVQIGNIKHPKCIYGCNRRLVKFNEDVKRHLNIV